MRKLNVKARWYLILLLENPHQPTEANRTAIEHRTKRCARTASTVLSRRLRTRTMNRNEAR